MASTDGGARLRLRFDPIRAVTYADGTVLPKVTSPPYDVVGPDGVAALEAADPHNVVRLILPRAGESDDRYHHAARDLATWVDAGVLITDPDPALWVYRHRSAAGSALGLVGSVGLDGPVLPHESTFEGPVSDRVALMATTEAQLEPILLAYHGDGAASDAVDAALAGPATISTVMSDGSQHDLWRLGDPETVAHIGADLADRRVLIADGHHRFAAYRRVHAARRSDATGTGLAVLVDAERHPLDLRGVHRVVAGLPLGEAVAAATAFGFEQVGADRRPGHDVPTGSHADGQRVHPSTELRRDGDDDGANTFGPPDPSPGTFVLTDGAVAVRIRPTAEVAAAMPSERSSRWRSLDAAVLKHGLIGRAWGLNDADERVSYVHDDAAAAALARRLDGVAALVAPPVLIDVMTLAEAGEAMPQKSTSFGPKPRTGLIMRWAH